MMAPERLERRHGHNMSHKRHAPQATQTPARDAVDPMLTEASNDETNLLPTIIASSPDSTFTETMAAQESLRVSEARYTDRVEDQTELICRFLPDCTLTFVNQAYARYFGRTPAELLGRSFKTLIPPEEHQEVDRHMARLTPANPLISYEHRVLAPGAGAHWQHWTDHAIFDHEGRLIEIQSVGRDITERVETQERLHRSAARAEALVRMAARLNAQLNLNAVLEAVCQEATHALNADGASVTLYSETQQVFHLMADYGLPAEFRTRFVPIPRTTYDRYVNRSHGDYIVTGITPTSALANAALYAGYDFRTLAGSTMLREGKLIGVINVLNRSRTLNDDEMALLRGLADQAATAIANAQLHDQVQQYTAQLEQRVAARTAELQRINEKLRAEVAERRRAEDAQRASEHKLRLILEQMPAILWTTDAELHFTSAMGAALPRISGAADSDANPERDVLLYLEQEAQSINSRGSALDAARCALMGESSRYERLHGERTFDVRIEPLRDAHNQIVGAIGLAVDVTERQQTEEEMRRALAQEKELSELKSRFVSMTSHEFRTPLSTILSSAELLEFYLPEWSDDKKLEHLRRIQNAVLHMTQMLNDVLVLGRADVGKLEAAPRWCDVMSLCHDLIEEARMHARPNHQIILEIEGVPRHAWVDEKLIQQALGNLLSNALKYSPTGGRVHLRVAFGATEIVFAVSDQGIGIPPEDQEHLFGPFHRGRNVGNLAGTGLGLAIVKKAVDLHAGTIEAVSQDGVGTTFTVVLPQPPASGV